MKFLVTGHKGFIGSHFVKRLDSYDGYDLVDGRDLKTIKFFPDCDVVVHLAATNGTDLFYTHPTDVSFNNTLPTFNLVNWYRDKDVKFVYASTCEIFNHTKIRFQLRKVLTYHSKIYLILGGVNFTKSTWRELGC